MPVSSERFVAERSANATRLAKRFDGARFSFYDAGLGACGEVNSNSDFVSAPVMSNDRKRCSYLTSLFSLRSVMDTSDMVEFHVLSPPPSPLRTSCI